MITTHLIKELRAKTGIGILECRKALTATKGDIEAAIEMMRKSGQAKAAKKASRVTAQGVIIIKLSTDSKRAVILEVNSETDFVASDTNFLAFATKAAEIALAQDIDDTSQLAKKHLSDGTTLEQAREQLIAKVGENIQLRRLAYWQSDGAISYYVHNDRIGVLVDGMGGDDKLGKDIAMHIAAMQPQVVSPDQVSQALIAKERAIFTAQAKASGKPDAIIDKMVVGRIEKFLDEISLLRQVFIRDAKKTVGQLLADHGASIKTFLRWELGEGIDKPQTDFAKAVYAQIADE